LIKASNGASDFGNKFGQPLITGSILTFEHEEDAHKIGFRQVIMEMVTVRKSKIKKPQTGDKIVILGGENYRIGMGGAAVSLQILVLLVQVLN
jgi:phosphoribosylformylglycinamidine synthase